MPSRPRRLGLRRGNPDQVPAKLRAYQAEGIEAFILTGYPHAAETDLFARHVLPHIQHGPLAIYHLSLVVRF